MRLVNYADRSDLFQNLNIWKNKNTGSFRDDAEAMIYYMNKVALATFGNFDIGSGASETTEPERFYHGFVLWLIVGCQIEYDYLKS